MTEQRGLAEMAKEMSVEASELQGADPQAAKIRGIQDRLWQEFNENVLPNMKTLELRTKALWQELHDADQFLDDAAKVGVTQDRLRWARADVEELRSCRMIAATLEKLPGKIDALEYALCDSSGVPMGFLDLELALRQAAALPGIIEKKYQQLLTHCAEVAKAPRHKVHNVNWEPVPMLGKRASGSNPITPTRITDFEL